MKTQINIGIGTPQREEIAEGLAKVLADTYTLYMKTHGFHWNVTGPMFNSLHTMFETQYQELWAAVDVIAERIRALDKPAPGSYGEFSKLTSIKESQGTLSAVEMIAQLLDGRGAFDMRQHGRLRLERERHETAETASLILKFAKKS